jgi:hypothetical protein
MAYNPKVSNFSCHNFTAPPTQHFWWCNVSKLKRKAKEKIFPYRNGKIEKLFYSHFRPE